MDGEQKLTNSTSGNAKLSRLVKTCQVDDNKKSGPLLTKMDASRKEGCRQSLTSDERTVDKDERNTKCMEIGHLISPIELVDKIK